MRVENISVNTAPVFKNNIEETNYEKMLERRANRTALVLLGLSGLATLGFAAASVTHDKKLGLKSFAQTVKNKGIVFDRGLALLNGEKFSGKLRYLTKNNFVKTRFYKDGLLSAVDTKRDYSPSTRLQIERNDDGKVTSFILKRLSLWKKPEIIAERKSSK